MEEIQFQKKVWYITGTSTGIGLCIVKKLLSSGYSVIAVTRSPEKLAEEIPKEQKKDILIIKTDICSESSVRESIDKGIAHFGKIDAVVNNAGFGIVGAVEELSVEEYKKAFDVNFFSALYVCHNVSKHFRENKSGLIVNISSIMGWGTVPSLSAYNCTKFALNSLTFCLQQELAPFNIDVVLFSPSGFKTQFVNNNMEHSKIQIPEYNQKETSLFVHDIVNKGRGDASKLADIVIRVSEMPIKPKNVFLGSYALKYMKDQWNEMKEEFEKNVELSLYTDYPDVEKIEW